MCCHQTSPYSTRFTLLLVMLTPVATKTTTRMKGGITEEEPADLHIPDNYVEFALKNAKPLPPITWNNWWKELNYLSVAILTISPSIAIYGALTTKLHPATAAFAVFYYFFTGLGPYLFVSLYPTTSGPHDLLQASRQDTTVFGLIARTTLRSPCRCSSHWLVPAPPRAPLDGGLVGTVLTTATSTPTSIRTMRTAVFGGATLAGCSSSRGESPASRT